MRINLILMSLVFCLIFTCSGLRASEALIGININKSVTVSDPIVVLRDVADIKTSDLGLQSQLANLALVKSPRVGYTKEISRMQIQSRIRENLNVDPKRLVWKGADGVRVEIASQKLASPRLLEKAKGFLHAQLNNNSREVRAKTSRIKQDFSLPLGEITLVPRMNSEFISKKMCVWVDVFIDNNFYRSVPVWFDMEVLEDVYVAKFGYRERDVVRPENFKLVRTDVTKISGQHVKSESFKKSVLLLKNLSQGEVLLSRNIKNVPAVIEGKILDLEVSEGSVRLRLKAIAERDAEIGEILKVKVVNGTEFVKARVVGKHVARVI